MKVTIRSAFSQTCLEFRRQRANWNGRRGTMPAQFSGHFGGYLCKKAREHPRPKLCPRRTFAAMECALAPAHFQFGKCSRETRNMRYLHTMLRVRNLDTALKFYG